MKNALILHGTDGNPNKHWYPWLNRELEKRDYRVWVPKLPHADMPSLHRYNDFLFPKWTFDNDSVIVGHSSGAVAVLGILQELPRNVVVDKAIIVAGFTDDLGWKELRELFNIPLNWKIIKERARKIILFHSDNDPYVPFVHGEKLRTLLSAELIVMKGQGHFNVSSNPKYRTFPALLEKILT